MYICVYVYSPRLRTFLLALLTCDIFAWWNLGQMEQYFVIECCTAHIWALYMYACTHKYDVCHIFFSLLLLPFLFVSLHLSVSLSVFVSPSPSHSPFPLSPLPFLSLPLLLSLPPSTPLSQ